MKVCYLIGILFVVLSFSPPVQAKEKIPQLDWQKDLELQSIDDVLGKEESGGSFSISQYVSDIMKGKEKFSFREMLSGAMDEIQNQLGEHKQTLLRILALGIFAGIFVRFAGTLGDRELGETGFYIVFLILTGIVSSGFYVIYEVAKNSLTSLVDFMKVLVPSFSLSICYGGGTQSSLLFYETMLIAMGGLEMVMTGVWFPGVQIYFFLNVVNQLAEHRFSRMVELIGSILRKSVKVLFGILIGYQGIQGLLVPVMDKVKNNTVWQSAKSLPGVGNTMGSIMDTVMGSGVLIKSAVGIGGIIGILLVCVYPLIKVMVFTLIYKIGGAVIQPIGDPRMVAVMQSAAAGGKILFGYIFAGALMFMISIIIILVGTNMVM